MINRYLLISFFLISLILPLKGQVQSPDQVLRDEVGKYGQAEVTIPYPGRQETGIITRNASITSVRDGKVTISLSRLTVEWFISRKYIYNLLPKRDTKGLASASGVSQAMEWQTYPTYTQYDSIMRKFAADYPALCRLDTIGTSVNDRLILALKISQNVSTDGLMPQVFYSSTIHGDETGGFILMLRLADYLLKNYSTDARVTNLVNNLEIWINPLANPDGTYTSGNTVNNAIRYNLNGYDLNRNFPDPVTPYSSVYLEQKETTDMVEFMRNHKFVISANFHGGDEVVNYPWDYPGNKTTATHADNAWFVNISRAYADTVHTHSAAGYLTDLDNGITLGSAWYEINGGRQDFITWYLQGREVTIELDYTKMTAPSELENLWQYNWRSLLGYLENAMYGVHGYVMDATSSNPVEARVYIQGYDKDSSQVYSDSLNGSFTRLLLPGTWNITFSANGYRDTTLTGLVVTDRIPLNIVVYMDPVITPVDTTYPYLPFLWPNPSSSVIKCILPGSLYGDIRITIIDQAGKKAREISDHYYPGEELELEVAGLPAGSYFVVFRNLSTGVHITSRIVVTARYK
jgi:hypothetical protein